MKTTVKIFSFGVFLLFTGCVALYKPGTIHSPLLKEKGEFNATAAAGLSGTGLASLQAAYAVSDHAGLMIDGMYHGRKYGNPETASEKLTILHGEAGVGYFTTFGNRQNLLFQCYAGCGYGKTSDIIDNPGQQNPEVKADYFNLFIQPGVAIISNHVELAFDLKSDFVQLFNVYAYLYDQFEWWNTDTRFHSDTTINFMNLEPTLTLKAGGKKLKGFVQAGLTIPVVHADSYFDISTESMLIFPLIKFSAGITYRF